MEEQEIKKYVCERFEINARKHLSQNLLQVLSNSEIRAEINYLTEDLVLGLKTWILAGEHPKTESWHHFKWPKTWWDALKARWFPLWLQKISPVEWHEEDILSHSSGPIYVCPHSDYKWPDKKHFEFMSFGKQL